MKKVVIVIAWLFFNTCEIRGQIIFFPSDSSAFQCSGCDSVFIFAENFAVTALGAGVGRIRYENKHITGENIPPSLRVKNPVGAILYRHQKLMKKIPAIHGRLDADISIEQVLRQYLVGLNSFQGRSSQGNVKINVWQQSNRQNDFLIFLRNGQILTSFSQQNVSHLPQNMELFTLENFNAPIDSIAGVWIAPPVTGNNFISDKILTYLHEGPLLVEFWDGLGWEMFEKAWISGLIKTTAEDIEMAYAMYPPETKANYAAMISDGRPDMNPAHNLFSVLHNVGINYTVFEGERLSFSIPGNVKLHTAPTPEEKDEQIFRNARAVIEQNSVPFLFIHYHGIDDLNHAYGPDAQRTISHLERMWNWHINLREIWNGTILLISDHGAHAVENADQINNMFRDKGTKGTHGDFRFSDMAVPVILHQGQQRENQRRFISSATIESARNRLFSQVISATDHVTDYAEITLVFGDSIVTLNADSDSRLFDRSFSYQYLRKGKIIQGAVQGRLLQEWIPEKMRDEIVQIIASAYDGHQVAFSAHDVQNNSLILALEDNSFSLYPLKDAYPNRVVKLAHNIEFLK